MKKLLLVAAVLFTFQSSSFAVSNDNSAMNTAQEAQAILDMEAGTEGTEGLLCDIAGAAAEAYCRAEGGDALGCQIVGNLVRDACNSIEI